jgi:hypothetical protein
MHFQFTFFSDFPLYLVRVFKFQNQVFLKYRIFLPLTVNSYNFVLTWPPFLNMS